MKQTVRPAHSNAEEGVGGSAGATDVVVARAICQRISAAPNGQALAQGLALAASALKITITAPATVAVITAMHRRTTGFASLDGLL